MAETNKNSMLPTYQGNYKDMIGAIKFGEIKNPCWFWIEDRNDIAFIHWEKNEDGEKILVPHVLLWNKIEELDEISEQLEGIVDPETKESVTVVEYVQDISDEVLIKANRYTDLSLEVEII